MSMRFYGIDLYGLLLDEETMKYIEDAFPDGDSDTMLTYDSFMNCGVEEITTFDGTASLVSEDGTEEYAEEWCDDTIFIAPVDQYNTLFSGAYKNMQELVDEMREKFGQYLPDDFDYKGKIRHLQGTVFG